MARIRDLMVDARDYSFPAGQMQAGLQLGTVEVPWLVNRIEELETRIAGDQLGLRAHTG